MSENETQAVETVERSESGFEFRGRFYTWHVSDTGKDLLLIDRITDMPVDDFFALIEDEEEESVFRGSVLLAMIATSLRHGNPSWSVERIMRTVLDLSVGEDIEMIGGEEEEQQVPPAEPAEEPPASDSPADESSSSPTPAES